MATQAKTAFVAMKFSGDHWRDQRYKIICEVLREAGFNPIRADQIQTSGPAVDEVCSQLESADLVVIDNTGDSHSVSYEIGYCHGIKRPVDRTLLITQEANIPFNYRHFRHRVYRNLRHLRRVLRDSLNLTTPLMDDQYGYAFFFQFEPKSPGYILEGAICIFKGLEQLKFTGRCECYAGEHFSRERLFTVGIGLRSYEPKSTPDFDWWMKLVKKTVANIKILGFRIQYEEICSEIARLQAMRADLVECGAAEFKAGSIVHVIGSDADGDFFKAYVNRFSNTKV